MKLISTLITIIASALSLQAHTCQMPQDSQDSSFITPIQGSFSKFEYQGFTMLIPAPSDTRTTPDEAIIKTPDGTLGMSLKIESDRGATPEAALQMCRRMATELHVKGATVSHLSIHGLRGARLQGTTEGLPITVLILADKGKYLKLVIIHTPEQSDLTNIIIDSITPAK